MTPSPSETPVVSCRDVTRTYMRGRQRSRWLGRSQRDDHRAVTALDAVSLSVNPGEILGIKGPSGSGKSTLLHLLAALDTPTSGDVHVTGESTTALSENARARLRLESIGIVFQRFYLLSALPAISNVALPLVERGLPKQQRRDKASAALHRVGLGQRQSHTPGELSGGEQQRVAIARALVTNPDLLIADEPTGELDTATGERILELFEDTADNGTAVIVASHDEPTLAIADRILELRDGVRVDT
ncbi:ABC transporter ATP-binding protein [Halobacterium salinarum]|uniref:ABC transporter ATP-binding protein n=1 Tax=Halobacterium salinarum TaxID=2242 RepID=UPI00255223E7|nr:ABC transporter ATP-binding protein [Halobacterium salinarum]MDL0137996.1 ABC transporter ATP-binding protein [Halobacterium salinarum]